MTIPHQATRRELLLGSGALFAWAYVPRLALAEGRDPRLLVIVLRGALDGLAAVAPIGDPDWQRLRGNDALTIQGADTTLPLDGFFALNPAMPTCTGCISCSRRPLSMQWPHLIANARILTVRMSSKAALRGQARRKVAGSIARSSIYRPQVALIRKTPLLWVLLRP